MDINWKSYRKIFWEMAVLLLEFSREQEEFIQDRTRAGEGKVDIPNGLIGRYKKRIKKQFKLVDQLYEKDLKKRAPEGKEVSKKQVFKRQYGKSLAENLLQIGANAGELVKGFESIAKSDRPAHEKEDVYRAFTALLKGSESTGWEREMSDIREGYLCELSGKEIGEIKAWEEIQEFGFQYLEPAKELILDLFKEASGGIEDFKDFKEEKVPQVALVVDGIGKKLAG